LALIYGASELEVVQVIIGPARDDLYDIVQPSRVKLAGTS